MKETTAFQTYREAVHSAGNSEDCSHFFMKLARIVLIPRIDCYEKYFPISVKKISNFLLRKDEDHML